MLRLEDFAKKHRCENYEVIKNALSGITSMPIIIPTNGEITVYEINNGEASKLTDADVIPLKFESCEINKIFLARLVHLKFHVIIPVARMYPTYHAGHFYDFNNIPLTPPALHSHKHNENVTFVFTKQVKINIENIWMPSINEEVSDEDSIRPDDVLKIPCGIGLYELKKIFADLEQQGMLKEGTTNLLENHFTESVRNEKVTNLEKPIEWVSAKYKLVYLLRRLKGSSSIDASDKQLEPHFLVKGKPFKLKKYSMKSTDDNSVVENIIQAYL